MTSTAPKAPKEGQRLATYAKRSWLARGCASAPRSSRIHAKFEPVLITMADLIGLYTLIESQQRASCAQGSVTGFGHSRGHTTQMTLTRRAVGLTSISCRGQLPASRSRNLFAFSRPLSPPDPVPYSYFRNCRRRTLHLDFSSAMRCLSSEHEACKPACQRVPLLFESGFLGVPHGLRLLLHLQRGNLRLDFRAHA